MNRREIRESSMLLIFEGLFAPEFSPDLLFKIAEDFGEEFIQIDDSVKELVNGVYEHLAELDEIISKLSPTRAFIRIAKLNVSILRLAIYEALYDDGTPTNAAIAESILLIEKYSYEDDKMFINGLLGEFSKSVMNK